MATNLNNVRFTESGNTVNVILLEGSPSNVEVDEIDVTEFGVYASKVVSNTKTTYFFPHSNVESIQQTESV